MPPTDFSSASYWSHRFEHEDAFEWLVPTSKVLPIILETLEEVRAVRQRQRQSQGLRVLHVGAGTSTLGPDLADYLVTHSLSLSLSLIDEDEDEDEDGALCDSGQRRKRERGIGVEVVDTDYVLPPSRSTTIHSAQTSKERSDEKQKPAVPIPMPFLIVDLLSPSPSLTQDLIGKYDLLIDKSTADAISCSPPLPPLSPSSSYKDAPSDPLARLMFSLSLITEKGARWVSISYSQNRFQGLSLGIEGQVGGRTGVGLPWRLIRKEMIATTSLPGGKRVREAGVERVVYEPETGVWAYTLERI